MAWGLCTAGIAWAIGSWITINDLEAFLPRGMLVKEALSFYQLIKSSKEAKSHNKSTFTQMGFDTVIGNVRASGGLGDLADDCMRGVVDV